MVVGGEKRQGDNLGEDGVRAGLQLGGVGDCGLSHWTIGDRVWLELRVEVGRTGFNSKKATKTPNMWHLQPK